MIVVVFAAAFSALSVQAPSRPWRFDVHGRIAELRMSYAPVVYHLGAAYDTYFFPNEMTFPSGDIDAAGETVSYVTQPATFPFAQTLVQAAGILYHLDGRTKAKDDPLDRTGWPMIKAGEWDGQNFNPDAPPTCGCDR